MGKYGSVTKNAVDLFRHENTNTPKAAWDTAAKDKFPRNLSSQNKSCPRDTFLGLCSAGSVVDIPSGHYTKSIKNKQYGIDALNRLKPDPACGNMSSEELWRKIVSNVRHNGQMDVVITLWNGNLLR